MAGDTGFDERSPVCRKCLKRPGRYQDRIAGENIWLCDSCWHERQAEAENGKHLCSECGGKGAYFIVHDKFLGTERTYCVDCMKRRRSGK